MKKITLEKLIYKNYLKTSLTSILFIELILVIIYFTVSNNMINKSIDFILKDIKQNTSQLVNEKSKLIDNKITDIEALAKILQKEHQLFFKQPLEHFSIKQPIFDYAKNGLFYKLQDNGGSSVVVSKNTKVTEELKEELIKSEIFDFTFETLVSHDKYIIAIYFNSHKNYTRYYPFLKDSHTIFPPNLKMTNYNFYYLANEKFNPKKEVILTDIYLDPAKKGWLLSAIVPIYNNDNLEGVSGIDISLSNFINNFLTLDLPYKGKSFIMNNKGRIIAMAKGTEKILDIKELEEYKYELDEKIDLTIYKSDNFSVLNYPDKKVVENFKNILENKDYIEEIRLNGKKYLLFVNKINRTSWYTISLINEEEVLKDIRELEKYYIKLGLFIILAIFLFYTIFFYFLRNKAKEFVNQINNPLLKIIEMTKNIGKSTNIGKLENCGIWEIDKLNNNFNDLSNELALRTERLVLAETKRIYHEKLANTDSLTGAFNRRYLSTFSNEYFEIMKNEKKDLSLLIIDLDDFKNINDTYGHEKGDIVLKELVNISEQTIRNSDFIVRFGGDEFIILLLNTKVEEAKLVANKIIQNIDKYNENKESKFTVSIGISYYQEDDFSINSIILRADESLYLAKKSGKNCIV
jgi:diguanylate cyclase (GGDEF)-like protein